MCANPSNLWHPSPETFPSPRYLGHLHTQISRLGFTESQFVHWFIGVVYVEVFPSAYVGGDAVLCFRNRLWTGLSNNFGNEWWHGHRHREVVRTYAADSIHGDHKGSTNL